MNERGEENFIPNYTGKFFDESSGLYYFNARWYDCELGRFTSQDPARDGVTGGFIVAGIRLRLWIQMADGQKA